jgi:hypothetical protein
MPLPVVLMTDVIRAVNRGQAHGGAYLVDLESGKFSKVINYTNDDIDWSGRGTGRGLRGIAYIGDQIMIASSQALLLYDRSFNRVDAYPCHWMSHCHEIYLDGDDLWVTSTLFDSLLRFHVPTRTWAEAVHISVVSEIRQTPEGPQRVTMPKATVYDPSAGPDQIQGPPASDTLHINQVWRHDGITMFSGVRVPMLCALTPDDAGDGGGAPGYRVTNWAQAPDWTHNNRPFRDGVLYNSTGRDAVVHADRAGNEVAVLPIPRYPEDALVKHDTTDRLARQAFGRGLCVTEGGIVIAGSSPGTVTAWDVDRQEILAKVNVTMDVRNAPHGLEVWPFDERL